MKDNIIYKDYIKRKIIKSIILALLSIVALLIFFNSSEKLENSEIFDVVGICSMLTFLASSMLVYASIREFENASEKKVLNLKVKDYFLYDNVFTEDNLVVAPKSRRWLEIIMIPMSIIFGIIISVLVVFVKIDSEDVKIISTLSTLICMLFSIFVPMFCYNSALVIERRYTYYKSKKKDK